MKVTNKEFKDIKKRLFSHLVDCDYEIETDDLINIINRELPDSHHYINRSSKTKNSYKILYTTGAGNVVQGGADIWTNHFLQTVWPKLNKNKNWRLLIDSKKPTNFTEKSLPKGLDFHFHFDDVEKTDEWLQSCSKIIVLHSHYHKREHIWKYEDKFDTIFVHAYPQEMKEVIKKVPELKRLQFNTNVDVPFYHDYLSTFKDRIWIGNNPSKLIEDFPNYTYRIPNFYEFKFNSELKNNFIDNGKIGFASRCESRKCIHWMHGHDGYILTGKYDFQNLKSTTSYTFPKIKFFQWDIGIHNTFMKKDFGIFHGAYFKEPFGYSIFQAVDYGKLPIIHTEWAQELDYKYRASSKNEFDKTVKKILFDSHDERLKEFNKIKSYMKQFDYKEKWAEIILNKIEK